MKIAKWLQEDRLPTKFSVVLSPSINYEINEVEYFNWKNFEGLKKWHDFIQQVLEYIANPSIAWDYAQRYRHLSNGECFINENGYEVGFRIETNEDETQTYVVVFRLGLNTEEYGLHIPTNESKKYNKRNKQYNTMNNTKKRIRFTESDLHRLIKEAINEYGGYDSLKQAYGEHDSLPFMRHLRRVGMESGYTRTDAERFKMQDRQERNRQNLDPLHLKAVQKIPQDVRDMNQYRDMRLNVTEAKKSQSRPLPFYYQEPKKAKDSVRGRYLRYSPEDSNFSSEGENFGWIMQDSYNESEMNKLIDDALTSLNKAREYAKDAGHGRWHALLNAICGELYHRVQNTDVRGLGPYAASSNIDM